MRSSRGASGFRSIVVAAGTPEDAEAAVPLVPRLAAEGARVVVVSVVEVPVHLPLEAHMHEEDARAREALRRAEALLAPFDLRVRTRTERGRDAAFAVVALAEDVGAELIVVPSSRRLSPARRLRLGETAEAILRHARCRVLVATRPSVPS